MRLGFWQKMPQTQPKKANYLVAFFFPLAREVLRPARFFAAGFAFFAARRRGLVTFALVAFFFVALLAFFIVYLPYLSDRINLTLALKKV